MARGGRTCPDRLHDPWLTSRDRSPGATESQRPVAQPESEAEIDPGTVYSDSMPEFHPVVIGIAFAALVVALTALARRLPVPTPIIQVIAGVAVGLVPGVGIPDLDPELVFFVFLPPILWAAAFFTSLREFRANLRPISLLAIGLVLAT